jgi:hypothetical protein
VHQTRFQVVYLATIEPLFKDESPKEQIKWASPQRGRKNSRRLRPQRRDVKAKRVQVDEIWSFTAAKQKNVAA